MKKPTYKQLRMAAHEKEMVIVEEARQALIGTIHTFDDYAQHELLPQVVINILTEFFNIHYNQGFFWWEGEMLTNTEIIKNLEHFVSYYLLDDGEMAIVDDKLIIAPQDDFQVNKLEAATFIISKINLES